MTGHPPTWCEIHRVLLIICLKRASVWLPIKIGDNDDQESHGFCDYHAGIVTGMAVGQDGEESEREL